jgi:hypothetical protein
MITLNDFKSYQKNEEIKEYIESKSYRIVSLYCKFQESYKFEIIKIKVNENKIHIEFDFYLFEAGHNNQQIEIDFNDFLNLNVKKIIKNLKIDKIENIFYE